MDKTAIKTFAINSRKKLMEDVELFLETAPKIFERDMRLIMNA